jgi:hypothetical protein
MPNQYRRVHDMTSTAYKTAASDISYHRGPSLGAVSLVFVALFVASLMTSIVMTHGARFVTPYDPVELARDYYTRFADLVRINSLLQFASAIPLGIFTATVVSRLKFLRVNVAGVYIALFGGFASSILLAISALSSWALSQPGVANEIGAMRTMQFLGFATGGVGHVAMLGLLLAGVSVPALLMRLTPRWLAWLGLVLAAICELSTLSMVFPVASILLPLGRFPAFIWLIGTGFTMPNSRVSRAGD